MFLLADLRLLPSLPFLPLFLLLTCLHIWSLLLLFPFNLFIRRVGLRSGIVLLHYIFGGLSLSVRLQLLCGQLGRLLLLGREGLAIKHMDGFLVGGRDYRVVLNYNRLLV